MPPATRTRLARFLLGLLLVVIAVRVLMLTGDGYEAARTTGRSHNRLNDFIEEPAVAFAHDSDEGRRNGLGVAVDGAYSGPQFDVRVEALPPHHTPHASKRGHSDEDDAPASPADAFRTALGEVIEDIRARSPVGPISTGSSSQQVPPKVVTVVCSCGERSSQLQEACEQRIAGTRSGRGGARLQLLEAHPRSGPTSHHGPSNASAFWGPTSSGLRAKVMAHGASMTALATRSRLALPPVRDGSSHRLGNDTTAYFTHNGHDVNDLSGDRCGVPSVTAIAAGLGADAASGPAAATGLLPDVHIVCTAAATGALRTALDIGPVEGQAAVSFMSTLLHASAATYFVFEPELPAGAGDAAARFEVLDLIGHLPVRDKKERCAAAVLREEGAPLATALRVSCGIRPSSSDKVRACLEYRGAGGLPQECGQVADPRDGLHVTKVMKLGTKTGIYAGTYMGHPVVVKHFAALQYAAFTGFQQFMHFAASHTASPLINAPTDVCFDRASGTVFQLQPLLHKAENLRQVMKREGTSLSWAHRLQIAIQILCVFDYLHAGAATGRGSVFTFDDNHPEQYMVTKSEHEPGFSGTFYRVRLVDIDTLQLAVGPNSAAAGSKSANPLAAYATRCRCFFCRGRSNCMFINTPEGYKGCGQEGGGAAGDSEAHTVPPKGVAAADGGRRCSALSDAWFEAQLLVFLVQGSVPFSGQSLDEVLQSLQQAHYPQARSGDADYDRVVDELFAQRVPESAALPALFALCRKHGCGLSKCPAPTSTRPYRDIVDASRLAAV